MQNNPYQPMPQPRPPKRHTGRKILAGAGILAAVAVGSAVAIAGGGPTTGPSGAVATAPTTWTSQFDTSTTDQAPAVEPPATETAQYPPQVEQARDSAQSYLELKGFSRDGLIAQLSSDYADGYPKDVATQAVDSLSVDWNAQAAKSAQDYLDLKGFSCKGLIEQLSSDYADKFTTAQATYGAHQTEACK